MRELLDRIKDPGARSAAEQVVRLMQDLGFEMRGPRRGHVKSAAFYKGNTYAFSFIPNQSDILFYCRNPATNQRPAIHTLARSNHPGQVNVDRWGRPAENKLNETKVRLRSPKDVEVLASWLRSEARQIVG
ncbi:hypothetical protein ACWPMX_05015 [Tsuneonella sp. HG094]|jgi:hypothetical protein